MSRLSTFFLYVAVLLSLGMGSVAHSAEGPKCLDARSAVALEHVSGDRDQVPADAEKGYPHHHGGCHGHQIGVPAKLEVVPQSIEPRVLPRPWDFNRMARAPSGPTLRPPIV